MSFFAELLTEAIGWPVCIALIAWCLLSGPKPIRRRRAATVQEPRLPDGFVPPSAALVPPKPRSPRDTSRTYPRPGRTRSKLTRICPVCGMDDPGNLDGKVFGWPAHHSCAEWLGDWHPRKVSVISGGEYAAEPVWCQSGTTNTIIFTGKGPVVASGGGAGGSSQNAAFSSEQVEISAMVASGTISLDKARERIASAFSVPPPDVGP